MQQEYHIALYPIAGFLLSLIFTRMAMMILPKLGFIDHPGARRIHRQMIPRGGGIAIIAAFLLTAFWYSEYSGSATGARSELLHFLFPATAITLTGLVDDRFNLSSRLKLFLQIVIAMLVWINGWQLSVVAGIELPPYLSLVLTVIWVVTLINGMNFIDGMDGLAAGLSLLAALALTFWSFWIGAPQYVAVMLLIMAGCCMGFLRYNFNPARIFMGDVGSMFLGLFFAVYSLHSMGKTTTVTSLLIPILALAIPLFDVALAFWRRLAKKIHTGGGKIMSPDKDHLHHRMLAQLFCQRRVLLRIGFWAMVFILIGFLMIVCEKNIPVLGYGSALFLLVVIIRKTAGIELFHSVQCIILTGIKPEGTRRMLHFLVPAVDILLLSGAVVASHLLFNMSRDMLFQNLIILVLPPVVALYVCGNYRVLWLRSGLAELGHFLEIIWGALIISCYFFYWRNMAERPTGNGVFLMVFFLGASLLLLLFRMAMIYFGSTLMWSLNRQWRKEENTRRLILIGGGAYTQIYLANLQCNREKHHIEVIGIVDDDPALSGSIVYGVRVLGKIDDLAAICNQYQIDGIMVPSGEIPAARLPFLLSFAAENGIALFEFQLHEYEHKFLPKEFEH